MIYFLVSRLKYAKFNFMFIFICVLLYVYVCACMYVICVYIKMCMQLCITLMRNVQGQRTTSNKVLHQEAQNIKQEYKLGQRLT